MYVCVCSKVTDHQIRDAVDRGINSIEELCDELPVAANCGRCRDCACQVMSEAIEARWAETPQVAFG